MSQVTQPHISAPQIATTQRAILIAALLALAAAVAVALVLAFSGGSSDTSAPAAVGAQPSLRSDGGPEESGLAGSVGSRSAAGPDESGVAAAISGAR